MTVSMRRSKQQLQQLSQRQLNRALLLLMVAAPTDWPAAQRWSNNSVMVGAGETANLSCTTTSDHPVDWYFERRAEDASPQPIFANDVVLDGRYDVVTSACRCPDDSVKHRREGGATHGERCRSYDLVIDDFQLDDVGLYTCCEHGDDLDNALCTFRMMMTGWLSMLDLLDMKRTKVL